MAKRRRGRDVSGILVLDKPQGMSSNEAVQKAKRLFNARKVGHTGALDPLATGVLPLCFGEATKFSQYLLTSDKKYWVRIKLGVATDSGDSDGQVMEERPVEGVTAERIEEALRFFRGEIDQVPSMFSAIKHQGQPLYKLARQGIEIEREARRVTVYSNRLLAFEEDALELSIHCSKGTYVRTIAQELGELLGCGGHVVALRRLAAGPYVEEDLVTFEELEAALKEGSLDPYLQPVASAVREWPEVRLTDNTAYYLRQGQPVIVPHAPTSGWVRLSEVDEDDGARFIGVGEILDDGRVAPRRLVVEQRK
jgi:tRNA pseudouridine55 synthase